MNNSTMGQYGDEGGFLSSPQFSSVSGGAVQEGKKEKCLAPIMIENILESSEGNFKLGSMDVELVTIVGIVRSVVVSSTKMDYTIQDETGVIGASYYIGEQDEDTASVVENVYCRVYGAPRMNQGKHHLIIYNIEPLHNLNEIMTHILNVINCQMGLKQAALGLVDDAGPGFNANQNTSMMTNDVTPTKGFSGDVTGLSSAMDLQGMSLQHIKVLHLIERCEDDVGLHRDVIAKMGLGISTAALQKILEDLRDEGHVYSTIDDNHFKQI